MYQLYTWCFQTLFLQENFKLLFKKNLELVYQIFMSSKHTLTALGSPSTLILAKQ